MAHRSFGLLTSVTEDSNDDFFFEVGSTTSGNAAADNNNNTEAKPVPLAVVTAQATSNVPVLSRPRSQSHHFPTSIASTIHESNANLARRAAAGGSSILVDQNGTSSSSSSRMSLPPLTQPNRHIFVRMKKDTAPHMLSLHLDPSTQTIHVSPYTPPPTTTLSAPLASTLSPSAAILAPTKVATNIGSPNASAAFVANTASGFNFSGILPTAAQVSSPMSAASSVASPLSHSSLDTPTSSSSSSKVKYPDPIPFRSLQSISRGYRSKKFQSLHPPVEVEGAALTFSYHESDGKKKSMHLLAMHSKSAEGWIAALQALLESNSNSSASNNPLAKATHAVESLSFEQAHTSDIAFHSILSRAFPNLSLPPRMEPTSPSSQPRRASGSFSFPLVAANTNAAAAAAAAVATTSSPTLNALAPPPVVPSRKNSSFHEEYVATKGFSVTPSERRHTRSFTVGAFDDPRGGRASMSAAAATTVPTPLQSFAESAPFAASYSCDVLPLLQQGAYFLKFGRTGSPKFRYYCLSSDCLTLLPFDNKEDAERRNYDGTTRKVPAKAIDLRMIERIHLGQASNKFKQASSSHNHAVNALSGVSFSIQMRSDAAIADSSKHIGPALIAANSADYHVWTRGLIHLMRALSEYDAAHANAAVSLAQRGEAPSSSFESAIPLANGWPPKKLVLDMPTPSSASDNENPEEAANKLLTDFSALKIDTKILYR